MQRGRGAWQAGQAGQGRRRRGGHALGRAARRLGIAAGLALLAAPAAAQVEVEPPRRLESEALRGESVYRELCETCHGRYGRGDGPLASTLAVPPPDFTKTPVGAGLDDEALLDRLMGRSGEAHAPMAIGRLLPEPVLRDAIAYLRRLGEPGGGVSRLAGRDIYQSACWVCHGREGRGDGPLASTMPGPKPRDFTRSEFVVEGREREVAKIVGKGAEKAFHGSTYMPEWSKRLSPQQIRDVVEFLKVFQTSSR